MAASAITVRASSSSIACDIPNSSCNLDILSCISVISSSIFQYFAYPHSYELLSVGWWSPTIIRGEDSEAVHIPNHKFTVNVVRNINKKTQWRIKTHLAISHLDSSKINNIVEDISKVLAKNPQVEQQRLHRRVFLENVNPENHALMILISCFVKTPHHEEYLCVKETILLDLLRVIKHHRARLATPIRTIQKFYNEPDIRNISFSDSFFTRGGPASKRPVLLIEPPYKINGEDKAKSDSKSRVEVTEPTYLKTSDDNKPSLVSKLDLRADDNDVKQTSRPKLSLEDNSPDVPNMDSKIASSAASGDV